MDQEMHNKNTASLSELKNALKRVSELDNEFQVFGANAHRYESYPVSNVWMERLESKLGIGLPADYRQFIQVIGYGAGPYYGLYHPDDILRSMRVWHSPVDEAPLPSPSRPFPFGRKQAEECWQTMSSGQYARYGLNCPADGCIPICHEGCGFETVLVTAGDLVGTLWSTGGDGGEDDDDYSYNLATSPPGIGSVSDWTFGPEPALSPLPTFVEWYRVWLDQCIADLGDLKRVQKEEGKKKEIWKRNSRKAWIRGAIANLRKRG